MRFLLIARKSRTKARVLINSCLFLSLISDLMMGTCKGGITVPGCLPLSSLSQFPLEIRGRNAFLYVLTRECHSLSWIVQNEGRRRVEKKAEWRWEGKREGRGERKQKCGETETRFVIFPRVAFASYSVEHACISSCVNVLLFLYVVCLTLSRFILH